MNIHMPDCMDCLVYMYDAILAQFPDVTCGEYPEVCGVVGNTMTAWERANRPKKCVKPWTPPPVGTSKAHSQTGSQICRWSNDTTITNERGRG